MPGIPSPVTEQKDKGHFVIGTTGLAILTQGWSIRDRVENIGLESLC